MEAKVNRLETERVVHMDEILSLRLAMQEMQAHMQGYVGGNLPPPPPIEQVPSPPVENPPPVHVAAAENVGEAGIGSRISCTTSSRN